MSNKGASFHVIVAILSLERNPKQATGIARASM